MQKYTRVTTKDLDKKRVIVVKKDHDIDVIPNGQQIIYMVPSFSNKGKKIFIHREIYTIKKKYYVACIDY